jgi:hypothetical protein
MRRCGGPAHGLGERAHLIPNSHQSGQGPGAHEAVGQLLSAPVSAHTKRFLADSPYFTWISTSHLTQ